MKQTYRISEESLRSLLKNGNILKTENEQLKAEIVRRRDELEEYRKVIYAVKGRIKEKEEEIETKTREKVKKDMQIETMLLLEEKEKEIQKQKKHRLEWNRKHDCLKSKLYYREQKIKRMQEEIDMLKDIINNNTVLSSDLPFYEDYESGLAID